MPSIKRRVYIYALLFMFVPYSILKQGNTIISISSKFQNDRDTVHPISFHLSSGGMHRQFKCCLLLFLPIHSTSERMEREKNLRFHIQKLCCIESNSWTHSQRQRTIKDISTFCCCWFKLVNCLHKTCKVFRNLI